MERRYLVATLALVATFAIFSREFRSGHLSNLPCPRTALQAEIACAKRYLADQLVAKVRPLIDRGVPEEQQMVAELNLPVLVAANEKVAEMQAQVAQHDAELNCEEAMRAQERALRAQEAGFRAQERSFRAAERAQQRAVEFSVRAQERAQEMNVRMALRAQEVSARATERAQRAIEKSRWKMIQPYAPAAPVPPVAPMPIDFEVNFPADFNQQVQAVDGRLAVKCVRTKVAAQQFRTVIVQRANQNMRDNVNVVISTQDVSGLSALTESPSSHTALHQIEHDLQHFQNHMLRTIDNAFASL